MLQKREVVIVQDHHFVILSSYLTQSNSKEEIFDILLGVLVVCADHQRAISSVI